MDDGISDAVTFKGITTVFDGLFPVVTVNKLGVARALKKRQPKWARVKHVHYLVGKSLNRLCVFEGLGTKHIKAAIREINDKQRQKQCDDCVRLHRPTNQKCSATLGIDTACSEEGVLYDFTTKKPVGRWKEIFKEIGGRDRIGVAEYSRLS